MACARSSRAPARSTAVSGSAVTPGWCSADNTIFRHGVSLLAWRPGGFITPHDTPPPSLSPSPTLGHSSSQGHRQHFPATRSQATKRPSVDEFQRAATHERPASGSTVRSSNVWGAPGSSQHPVRVPTGTKWCAAGVRVVPGEDSTARSRSEIASDVPLPNAGFMLDCQARIPTGDWVIGLRPAPLAPEIEYPAPRKSHYPEVLR